MSIIAIIFLLVASIALTISTIHFVEKIRQKETNKTLAIENKIFFILSLLFSSLFYYGLISEVCLTFFYTDVIGKIVSVNNTEFTIEYAYANQKYETTGSPFKVKGNQFSYECSLYKVRVPNLLPWRARIIWTEAMCKTN